MSWTVSSRACRSRPADRARFAAVCRAWRSAARQLPSHLPWIVFPGGTFCTAGVGAACFSIPGLPDDATCLGAAHDCWLAIDCTDDVVRRATFPDTAACDPDTGEPLVYARRNVKHNHTYLLHNPFSNLTVPLPELDAVVGYMAETFTIRKVLMRSPAPDDFIAVTTNNCNYNIILCRREKGTFVLPDYRIIDVVFLGDTLYGITSGEELLAFHLSEDDEDGRPNVTRIELVIKNPLSRYYYGEFPWYWPEHVVEISDKEAAEDEHNNGGGDVSDCNEDDEDSDDDVEEPNQEENDNSADEGYLEEEDINEDEESDDDELADQALEDILNGDDLIPNNVEREVYDEAFEERYNREVPYEPKDEIVIGRYLVKSRTGELLLVRHRYLLSPYSHSYTHNVQVLKANLNKGKWAASDGLPKGEALFLGQSYSKCTQAHGDIREGFVYYLPQLVDDAYDMTSCTTCNIAFGWPWQCKLEDSDWLTWLFPPEVVV